VIRLRLYLQTACGPVMAETVEAAR